MASANCKSPRNEKVCADNGLPFCLPLPPTGTDVHPLLLLPLLLCPFLRPGLLPLMPLAPAPVDVPGPAAHHQQHHHSCLRCRLQLPAAVPVPRPSSSPAPPHRCCLQPPQQLSTPYATNITTLCVTNFYCVLHHCTSTQIVSSSSWPHISKDQSTRRSKFAEMKATQQICTHSNTSHSALMSHVRVSVH